jgi:thiol:disulfide interchange protein DsbD
MRTCVRTLALLLAAAAVTPAQAQTKPKVSFETITKNVSATIEPAVARRGEAVTFRLSFDVEPGFHTYPMQQVDAEAMDFVTKISFEDESAKRVFVPVGSFKGPEFITVPNPISRNGTVRYVEGKAVWERTLVVRPDSIPGARKIKVKTQIQVCNKDHCYGGPNFFEIPITVADTPAVAIDLKYSAEVAKATGVTTPPPSPAVKVPGTAPEAKADDDFDPFAPPKPKVAVDPPKPAPAKPEPGKAETEETGANKIAPAAKEEPVATPAAAEPNASAYKTAMAGILQQIQATAAPKAPTNLLAFILSGIFWGAVSLITPCVFPMIPITVSFFLKQSEKEHHKPVMMALVYCTTIVVVLTAAAVLLLSAFRELSVMPITNYIVGGLFVFFALSLFGMYEIELPSFLTRYTSSHEGQGGLAGTVFMALTFTLVSFSCVAPFLGGFGGTSATSSMTWAERIFGGLAFSITFASPFFILALFPTLLKKMPKSGSWLNSVKVVMGFLELAAALKFFRTAEVNSPTAPTLFTYDLVLGLYIAISVLCGLYLLGIFRLPHDTPSEHLGVPRMVLAMIFLAMAIYLVPGLFRAGNGEKQRPGGAIYAWIDSFLLPEEEAKKGDLVWTGDLPRAVAEARQKRKETGKPQFVFIDFTGKTCVNCA